MQAIITLHDGNLMPQLGLGVWRADIEQAASAVAQALEVGYRLIDTASIYGNEEGVGAALQNAAVAREELFITTKLWNDDQARPQAALEASLKRLGLDYVDLYLIHWPQPARDQYLDAWRGLIKLRQQGLAKSIGVSNFNTPHLQRLLDATGVAPVLNQIELHPLLQQRQLRAWHAAHQIATQSWSPLAKGQPELLAQPLIAQLAQKYGKTPAQVIIRWHLDCGLIVIPKSVTPARIRENFEVFDFQLDASELAAMTQLDIGKRLGPNPDTLG